MHGADNAGRDRVRDRLGSPAVQRISPAYGQDQNIAFADGFKLLCTELMPQIAQMRNGNAIGSQNTDRILSPLRALRVIVEAGDLPNRERRCDALS